MIDNSEVKKGMMTVETDYSSREIDIRLFSKCDGIDCDDWSLIEFSLSLKKIQTYFHIVKSYSGYEILK